MHWFKVLLVVLFTIQVIFDLARVTGWRPTPSSNGAYVIQGVFSSLVLVGIFLWV